MMIEWNKIICGDCIDILSGMDDKSIDLILTDPPYGIGLEYDNYDDTESNWDNLMRRFIPQARRIADMVILPCCRIAKLEYIYNNWPPDWIMCWYKGSPGHSAFVGFNDWEPMLVYGKTSGCVIHDYIAVSNTEKMGGYGHPCPKPLRWAKKIISMTCKEGMSVMDPFCGSGTVCVAAQDAGMRWLGIDISENYCEISRNRMKECNRQTRLL